MKISVLVAATAIGLIAASGRAEPSRSPRLSRSAPAPSPHVAHIYFNPATGEKVATLITPVVTHRAADAGEVWMADNTLPCAGIGPAEPYVAEIDSPNCTTCWFSSNCSTGAAIFLDWGDAAFDQVVDAVSLSWSTAHPDTDADGDGVGDGVEGFGATWAWYDADNGFNSDAREPILTFTLGDLPGAIGGTDLRTMVTYTATIELGGEGSSPPVFEIGDTDGVASDPRVGAFNPGAGVDLDSDGLADFSYSMVVIQPGDRDWDGDGTPDGDPANQARAGWMTAAPPGVVHPEPDFIATWLADPPPAAQGTEDAYDFFTDVDSDGVFELCGTYWFGGLRCSTDPSEFRPYAQFYMVLLGPPAGEPCAADLAPPFGTLDFFDIAAYLRLYADENPIADLAIPSGALNIFDVQAYLASYNAGCP